MKKKITAAAIILSMVMVLTGCSGKTGKTTADASTTYKMWLYSTVDSSYYVDYNGNAPLKYALQHWNDGTDDNTQIAFQFLVPPAGTAADNYSTMINSGDLPDILDGSISDTPSVMCEDGIIIELTDYINKYMPNYKAALDADPDTKNLCCTIDDEGNEHYYEIASLADEPGDLWCGYEYRRDWIVKYGVNPVTGQPFSGGFTGDKTKGPYCWEDDVMFPSGGTDPVYISDWEWMFDIFMKAYDDLNLDDSYCMSIYYAGFTPFGQMVSAFDGDDNGYWYRTQDNKCVYGATQDSFRAYMECLNNWYNHGWLDPYFNERSSDMFYAIDDKTVRKGKIGMWYGIAGTLGNRMESDAEPLTEDIYVAACYSPINDVYGDDSAKGVEPYTNYGSSRKGSSYLITKAALDRGANIEAICRFFDYFYT